jgi:hypothetical protein
MPQERTMNDPRDKRFYALRKKGQSQLSRPEIEELIGYCDKMIRFVPGNMGRRAWVDIKSDLEALLEK